MFCRYCGNFIPEDSVFCSKCGKRTEGATTNPRLQKIVTTLHLRTPYPYFGLLLVLFIGWIVSPQRHRAEYAQIKWTIEQDKKLDTPADNTYQQALSLVLENTGSSPIKNVPVELSARIEPEKPSEVVADFLGQKLVILQAGKPLPLDVVLADAVEPGAKRRYLIDGAIQSEAPFKVTYEIREPGFPDVLSSYSVAR